MIGRFIEAWEAGQETARARYAAVHPGSYRALVQVVIEVLSEGKADDDDWPDPARIHEIDDGEYQGTLVYVIGAMGYQPDRYWFVMVGYGSCSGCDTLQAICDYSDEVPTDAQVADYLRLALHIVQGLREMGGE